MVSVFDPVINQVIALVEAQVEEAKKTNNFINVNTSFKVNESMLISIASHSRRRIRRLAVLAREARFMVQEERQYQASLSTSTVSYGNLSDDITDLGLLFLDKLLLCEGPLFEA